MKRVSASSLLFLSLLAGVASADAPASRPQPSPSPKARKPPVYTEEDLKKARGHVVKLPESAVPQPSGAKEPSKGPSESEWRARHAAKKADIAAAEERVKALEAKIESLRLDLSPTGLMDPNRYQTMQAEMGKATTDLEAARKAVAAARQALSDFEDEARRASVPPGWLR